MPPPQNQPPTDQQPTHGLQPNDLAASLGFITTLNQHAKGSHPSQKGQDTAQAPQMAPTGTEPQEPVKDLQPEIDALKTQFDALKKEVAVTIREEMVKVKEMIQSALAEDNSNEK